MVAVTMLKDTPEFGNLNAERYLIMTPASLFDQLYSRSMNFHWRLLTV
jgi:hypothetical protein